MNEAKRTRLAAAGYQSTSVADFLGLSTEQNELIEIKVALTIALKKQRNVSDISQNQLAEKIGSSQSRIAKMEAGDPHVSLDLILRALIALGTTRSEIAEVIFPMSASALRPQLSPESSQRTKEHYKLSTCPQPSNLDGISDNKKSF